MFRSSQTLYVAIPASATAGSHGAPSETAAASDGSPRRDPRRRRALELAVVLTTCGFVAFVGWVLSSGDWDLETRNTAAETAPLACTTSSCTASFVPVSRPLPREWRWNWKKIEYEHMYRE